MNELEKNIHINILIDYYGGLLTPKQKKVLELYYFEDLSISEISQLLEVSRNAVFDSLKKSTNILEKYEEELNLVKKHYLKKEILENITNMKIEEITKKIEEL